MTRPWSWSGGVGGVFLRFVEAADGLRWLVAVVVGGFAFLAGSHRWRFASRRSADFLLVRSVLLGLRVDEREQALLVAAARGIHLHVDNIT